MSSGKFFAGMPSINIPRSKWNTSYNVTGSYKHGYLNVIDAIPVLPGDSVALRLRDLTRMQTPIAPIYGNIKQHFAAFFVPERLVWEHTEEHYGANKTSAGYQSTTYYKPVARFDNPVVVGSLSHQLGKPTKANGELDADGKHYYVANILKERCYYLIWSEYFRAQQITNPVLVNVSDSLDSNGVSSKIGSWNGSQIDPGSASSLMKVSKDFDVFTACTMDPQYGNAVELPLGTKAPIMVPSYDGSLFSGSTYNVLGFETQTNKSAVPADKAFDTVTVTEDGDTFLGQGYQIGGAYADLSSATAAKVNDVRYAFAVQKYLERANFAGNYFFGILQVHYGVTSPDSRLQRPEFLGSWEEDILVHQVVATADTTNGTPAVKTSVGNTGAVSVTASGDINLFNKAFVEPGFIVLLRYCRHRQVYSQGVMKEDFVKDRFETYTPELCNLGDDFVRTRELYWKAGESEVFGYQEHWYQYRFRYDRVTGMLDPNGSNSLDFWTLANKFTTKPQLNDDFIMESRSNLDRALTTGSSYDEYVSDTWINLTWTREMPVRTIPGLIDHFGAM